jgi:hypothetical protein
VTDNTTVVFDSTSGRLVKQAGTAVAALAGKFAPTGNITAGNGMYLPAANTVAFSTAGAERLRVDSSGNVGINTTSPATTLDVNGNVTITDKIIHSGDTNTAIRFPAADTVAVETNGSERLRVDSSGRLLVGTSTNIRGGVIQVARATANTEIQIIESSDSGEGPRFSLTRTRGSNLSTPSAIQNDNFLGRISWSSWDTAAYREGASIGANADGQTWASGDCPTRLVFSTTADGGSSPSERLRIDSSGNVGIGLTPTSRNNTRLQIVDGIGFPATQVASTDANTLDDYEEGTWTPVVGGTSIVYTRQIGSYTKIGNLVFCRGGIEISSGTPTASITGLPFTSAASSFFEAITANFYFLNNQITLPAGTTFMGAFVNSAGTTLTLRAHGSTTAAATPTLSSTFSLIFSFTYNTSS